MNVHTQITIDLIRPGMPARIKAMQRDSETRTVTITLLENGLPWEIPADAAPMVVYCKPFGKPGQYDTVSGKSAFAIDGNAITVTCASQLFTQAGLVTAAVVFRRDEAQLATFPFFIEVTPNPNPDGVNEDTGSDSTRVVVDPTFTVSGAAADALLTGQRLADLEYNQIGPIRITDIGLTTSVAMIGSVVSAPVLMWVLNREPAAQWVEGERVDNSLRARIIQRDFTAEQNSATVTVEDERGVTASAAANIAFYNAVYYGKQSGREMPTDAALRALAYQLQDSRGVTLAADAGAGEYLLYACPSRLGTPEFWANGFQGGFSRLGPMLHTNAAGYAEEYDVWLSNAAGLADVTVTVK